MLVVGDVEVCLSEDGGAEGFDVLDVVECEFAVEDVRIVAGMADVLLGEVGLVGHWTDSVLPAVVSL